MTNGFKNKIETDCQCLVMRSK